MTSQSPDPVSSPARVQPETFRARTLSASFSVKDLQASLAWYRDVMGFFMGNRYERDGVLRAVALKAGAVEILLGQDDGAKGLDRVKGVGFSLQFTTSQDIDALAARVRSHGVALESEPADTPWGARVFRVRDPDGFLLVISTER